MGFTNTNILPGRKPNEKVPDMYVLSIAFHWLPIDVRVFLVKSVASLQVLDCCNDEL